MRRQFAIAGLFLTFIVAACGRSPLDAAVKSDDAAATVGAETPKDVPNLPDAYVAPRTGGAGGAGGTRVTSTGGAGGTTATSTGGAGGSDLRPSSGGAAGRDAGRDVVGRDGPDARDAQVDLPPAEDLVARDLRLITDFSVERDVAGRDVPDARDAADVADVPATYDVNTADARDGSSPETAPDFCASKIDAGILLCDDFSSSTPWSDKTTRDWPDMTAMNVSISGGRAFIQDPGGWSSSYVQWNSTFDFRNTSLEADITADTAARSLSYVIWGGPPTYVTCGLQRDEQMMHLWVVVNGTIQIETSGSVSLSQNRVQRVALQILANGQIRGTVDGVAIVTTTADLSAFPATLAPGIGANAYPSQRFTYDNISVRRITGF